MQAKFRSSPMSEFWLSAAPEFKHLSRKAVDYLLPFASTYLCEYGLSSLTTIKRKYRATLATVENDLRVCLSNIQPRLDRLCAKKQAQVSN